METKTCMDDVLFTSDQDNIIIQREKGFLSLGDSRMGGGLKRINSIVINCLGSKDNVSTSSKWEDGLSLKRLLESYDVLEPASVVFGEYNIQKTINVSTDKVTVIVTADNHNLPVNVVVIVNDELDETTLVKLFKIIIQAKTAALWDLGMLSGFLDLSDSVREDSILVACDGPGDLKTSKEVDKLRLLIFKCVKDATDKLLRDLGCPRDVVGYMEDVGVYVEDLVDAGMQLCVGVEKTPELNIKLHKQLLKSLEDLNVVSLIMAGIRLEEDYARHRVRGVNVDDDPAYLYSDEVLGMAVANQIAGTKALFNFKRYDEEKPGIISTLGPVLDDIFAGLVAGSMSKIFEE